jgi:lipoprotein NlpD
MAALLVGCASPTHRAPVEDRAQARQSGSSPATTPAAASPATDTSKTPLPGAENAGKPGYYTIKPGDTVLRVALEHGQNWRDIVRWNNMDNPNVIEVGQVLRVAPPDAAPAAASATGPKPVTTARIETKPLDGSKPPVPPSALPATPAASGVPPAVPMASTTPAPQAAADSPNGPSAEDNMVWAWPAPRAAVGSSFDGTRNRGLIFVGKAGDAVLAAADGKVIYAGNGLRGYGNLLIIQHSKDLLTTYAHNQTLLVKEDQSVKRGQKIAEMGATDAERVQLQFELRRLGKPVDPAKFLPQR